MSAGIPYLPIDTNLPTHPKSLRLESQTGVPRAWSYVLEFWLWCGWNRPDGNLSGLSEAMVDRTVGWPSTAETSLLSAMRTAGFIDGDVLHGWMERVGAYLSRRETSKERQKRFREKHYHSDPDAGASRVTNGVTNDLRGEKRREEDKKDLFAANAAVGAASEKPQEPKKKKKRSGGKSKPGNPDPIPNWQPMVNHVHGGFARIFRAPNVVWNDSAFSALRHRLLHGWTAERIVATWERHVWNDWERKQDPLFHLTKGLDIATRAAQPAPTPPAAPLLLPPPMTDEEREKSLAAIRRIESRPIFSHHPDSQHPLTPSREQRERVEGRDGLPPQSELTTPLTLNRAQRERVEGRDGLPPQSELTTPLTLSRSRSERVEGRDGLPPQSELTTPLTLSRSRSERVEGLGDQPQQPFDTLPLVAAQGERGGRSNLLNQASAA